MVIHFQQTRFVGKTMPSRLPLILLTVPLLLCAGCSDDDPFGLPQGTIEITRRTQPRARRPRASDTSADSAIKQAHQKPTQEALEAILDLGFFEKRSTQGGALER